MTFRQLIVEYGESQHSFKVEFKNFAAWNAVMPLIERYQCHDLPPYKPKMNLDAKLFLALSDTDSPYLIKSIRLEDARQVNLIDFKWNQNAELVKALVLNKPFLKHIETGGPILEPFIYCINNIVSNELELLSALELLLCFIKRTAGSDGNIIL
ncbi:hypothetical protein C2G38_2226663 [Gigaspora rosea]|uniref:Uncharacterized protein n=1 Tax=Gigaspora rosea TaxID=44941 RepID=A0A397U107_9GLOM|nr:hypothetical protein C2G38_2226663 [Gigaspora rosea]